MCNEEQIAKNKSYKYESKPVKLNIRNIHLILS